MDGKVITTYYCISVMCRMFFHMPIVSELLQGCHSRLDCPSPKSIQVMCVNLDASLDIYAERDDSATVRHLWQVPVIWLWEQRKLSLSLYDEVAGAPQICLGTFSDYVYKT